MMKVILFIALFIASAFAFAPTRLISRAVSLQATKITDGVEFDTIAREWRLKWSADNDKKSLASAQQSRKR